MSYSFEVGPIRPPSEAQSILLRVTRNCPWNKCTFCHTYKGQKFSKRDKSEVINDIDSMFAIAERIKNAANSPATKTSLNSIHLDEVRGLDDTPAEYYRYVAFWLSNGMRTMFLQDANSLVMNTTDLAEILRHAKKRFPSIERITSYARSKTVSKKTLEELKELKSAGLSRIHIGLESGSDKVLDFINKGVTAEEHISAGKKAIEAGFDLSEYYMPGLGGKELLEENALESARVLNQINPTFIRLRSTVPLPGTPLRRAVDNKEITAASEEERVREIKLFIETLGGITSIVASDHMMNLLEDVGGSLPEDKGKMLKIIDAFLNMDPDDKERFIIGRRLGYYHYVSDYRMNSDVEKIRLDVKERFSSVDEAIMEVLKNFI